MARNPKPERRLYRCHPSEWKRWLAWALKEASPWRLPNEIRDGFERYRAESKNTPYAWDI